MSICEISGGSFVGCKLGVAGGSGADVVLQACNAASIRSAGSFQALKVLGIGMGVLLLGAGVLEQRAGFLGGCGLGLLGLGGDVGGQGLLGPGLGHFGAGQAQG